MIINTTYNSQTGQYTAGDNNGWLKFFNIVGMSPISTPVPANEVDCEKYLADYHTMTNQAQRQFAYWQAYNSNNLAWNVGEDYYVADNDMTFNAYYNIKVKVDRQDARNKGEIKNITNEYFKTKKASSHGKKQTSLRS